MSVWPRCDAKCSPLLKATITILHATRPAYRGRMNQPVHCTAQLRARELDRPLDEGGGRPAKDANELAPKQAKVCWTGPEMFRPFPCSSLTPATTQ